MFNLTSFINKYVTKRPCSMFEHDVENNSVALREKIEGKSVLVIGGAGSIGSSFIRSILPFKPAELVIVDTNENALTELTRELRSNPQVKLPNEYFADKKIILSSENNFDSLELVPLEARLYE